MLSTCSRHVLGKLPMLLMGLSEKARTFENKPQGIWMKQAEDVLRIASCEMSSDSRLWKVHVADPEGN